MSLSKTSVKEKVSPEEWQMRVDLAACYRIAHHYRMTDHIYTHISARVPGPEEHFLINPFGTLFEEVTASNLVKVDVNGEVLLDSTGLGINPAGFLIHSAIHRYRHDVMCVMHTHTAAGLAVAAQEQGLLPITQHAMRFHGRVAYHDYEGLVLTTGEQGRLVRDMGTKNILILRNHGLLTCGTSVREAFEYMYFLERACQAQVATLSCGVSLRQVSENVLEETVRGFERPNRPVASRDWAAALRLVERLDPSFRT